MRFSSRRGLGCLGVAIEHNLLKIIRDIKVCTDFKILYVKVPIIFFGTPVFSARRDGRYYHRTMPRTEEGATWSVQCAGNGWGSREGLGEASSGMEPCSSKLSVWTAGIERSTSQQLSGLSFHAT
jgi:hypothetical protein